MDKNRIEFKSNDTLLGLAFQIYRNMKQMNKALR